MSLYNSLTLPIRRIVVISIKIAFFVIYFYAQPLFAQVNHVSVHKRLFEMGNLPMLKLNIVAPVDDITRLEFVLTQILSG